MKKKINKLKKQFSKKYRIAKNKFLKSRAKYEVKIENRKKDREKARNASDAIKNSKKTINSDKNKIVINTSSLSKEQILAIRKMAKDIFEANSKVEKIKKLNKNQVYYSISPDETKIKENLSGVNKKTDKFNIVCGNAFPSRYAAKKSFEKFLIATQLSDFAKKYNGVITPGRYFYLFAETVEIPTTKEIVVKHVRVSEYNEKIQGAILFSSSEIAEAAINHIGEDKIKKLFN